MGFVYCNLRVLMAERNLNIQKVKDETTLSRTTISNLFNNNGVGVQFDTIAQLCELLNCEIGDLFKHVDISIRFDIEEEKEVNTAVDTHITDPVEGDGFDYIYELDAKLMLKASVIYKKEENNYTFNYDFSAHFSEDKDLRFISVYENNLLELIEDEYSHYVYEYFEEELDQFIHEWASDYVDNIELDV